MKPFFRKLHRWLGLAMALQVIAWMSSGLYFAIFPIETIRGEHLTVEREPPDTAALGSLVAIDQAWQSAGSRIGQDAVLADISLQTRGGEIWYRVSGTVGDTPFTRLVNGTSGQVAPRLEADDAQRSAMASLAVHGVVESVSWVQETEPGSEIRGRALPLWRVDFSEPESLRLYIDPWTGDIAARRTARWRVFDFLWMLHIMDFEDRDDFNTPLLKIAAALGLLVALSGVVLWAISTRLFRNRRQAAMIP